MRKLNWLGLFLPLAAIASLLYWFVQGQHIQQEARALILLENTTLQAAGERFSEQLNNSARNLFVIANTPAVKRFIESPTPENRTLIEPLFQAFAGGRPEFLQLRLLDDKGVEVVRINRSAVGPQVVEADRMQDKGDRPYFTDVIRLRPRVIWVSDLNLNEEYGQIERPLKPVLRMSMRLQSASGRDFVLVVNLRGSLLLKGLREILGQSRGHGWMINDQGYWLVHPDASMQWGAQLNLSNRLQQVYPGLADALSSWRTDVVIGDSRSFVSQLKPMTDTELEGIVARSPEYSVIIHHENFAAALPGRWDRLPWLLLAYVIIAISCSLFILIRNRALRSEADHRALLERTRKESEEHAWMRETVYQLSLKLSSCGSAKQMAREALNELAPLLGLAAGCVFSYNRQRATLLASYGAADLADGREFGAGQGLVGEVAKTGEERRMSPPLPGYFDLSAGCGKASATELRVLPLAVHGHVVGVLELAFVKPLDPRDETYLAEVIPLLALHLDGMVRTRRQAA